MLEPLVSVIIPAYNVADCLGDALLSVRRQGRTALAIIVVDDASQDATAEVAARLGADRVFVCQTNGGPAAARNRGLERARGELLAFLDADDIWPEGSLARQLACLAEAQAEVVLGRTALLGSAGAEGAQPRSWFLPLLGSTVFRRTVFERVGRFDESLRYSEDHDWFLRARELGVRVAETDAVTLLYRARPQGLTRSPSCPPGYQLTGVLKRSLDRRRASGVEQLTPLPGQTASGKPVVLKTSEPA